MRLFPLLFLLACTGDDANSDAPDETETEADADTDTDTDADIEPADLVGRTWIIDNTTVHVAEPPGVFFLLSSYLTDILLVSITGASGDALDGLMVPGQEGHLRQDYCARTEPLPTLDFAARPDFVSAPGYRVFEVDGYPMPVWGFTVAGTVSADGAQLTQVSVEGTFDTRPLVPLLDDPGAGPDALCALGASDGVTCIACPDGSGAFCVFGRAEHLEFHEVALSVVEITDPLADPSCTEEVSFCACATGSWTAGAPLVVATAALIRRRRG